MHITALIVIATVMAVPVEAFDYVGTWRFSRQQFRRQHRLMPSFMVNRAMKTRLVLEKARYLQFRDEAKTRMIKTPRPLRIERQEANRFILVRIENDTAVEFILEQRGDDVYYLEGDDEYQLIRVH